jgi:hypothetical protein
MEFTGKITARKVRGIGDDISKELDQVLHDLQLGDGSEYGGSTTALIRGGLTVQGHDYWVILEYGSSPRTSDPTPNKPGQIVLDIPDDLPSPKYHSQWYHIYPRRAKRLVYYDSRQGKVVVRKWVRHPGNLARGFIRKTIAQVEASCLRALQELDNDEDTLPTRQEIRQILNIHLRLLLISVREATPVQDRLDRDGFINDDDTTPHLKDAWGVELAK